MASRASCSIAAATSITGGFARWPRRHAKQGWNFRSQCPVTKYPVASGRQREWTWKLETGNWQLVTGHFMLETREKIPASQLDLKDTVVNITRVTKVVKGGKNLSFSALVVIGDGHGVVGFGVGKAKEVPSAIKKGIEAAKKSLIRVPLKGTTVPHPVLGRF